MGEVITLKPVTVSAGAFLAVKDCAGPGDLRVVLGKVDWPDAPSRWVVVIRAPGAPDMGVADGPWPEANTEHEGEVASLYIRLAQATLQIARTRVSALMSGAFSTKAEDIE